MARYVIALRFAPDSATATKALEVSATLGSSSHHFANSRIPVPHVPLFEVELNGQENIELAMMAVSYGADTATSQNPNGLVVEFREVRRAGRGSNHVLWTVNRTNAIEKLHEGLVTQIASLRSCDLDLSATSLTPPEFRAWKQTGCPHVGTTWRPAMYLGTLVGRDTARFRDSVVEHKGHRPTLVVIKMGEEKQQGKIVRKFDLI